MDANRTQRNQAETMLQSTTDSVIEQVNVCLALRVPGEIL